MTSPSPLERLAGPGNVLAKEAPDAKEFTGLVPSGLIDSCRKVAEKVKSLPPISDNSK